MKTALVLGITGTFGGAMARALKAEGYAITTLMRDPARCPSEFRDATIIQGDAMHVSDVQKAAQGVEIMVYGLNPPSYDWVGKAIPMLENAAQVAEEKRLTVLFPGNVYVLDPAQGSEFDESAPLHPVNSKGETRLQMEQRLHRASQHGAKVIILRAGDFIARNTKTSWIQVLIKAKRRQIQLSSPGRLELMHTWAYIPDMAQTAVELLKRREQLPALSVFHFKGYRVSFREMAAAIQRATGMQVSLKRFAWLPIYVMAPFSVMFRGLLEMRYLWDKEVSLEDGKLRALLGDALPHTPLEQALIQSKLCTVSH